MGPSLMLLDSVIVIDHLNGVRAASDFIADNESDIRLSVITRAEVLAGVDEHGLVPITRLLRHFPTLPLAAEDADAAAELHRKYRWKLPDAFQAALAINHSLMLVTRNTKDFPPDVHAFVSVPYELA